jgi:hypothetical protein
LEIQMTDGGRVCALPGCDRIIEQQLDDTSQRKYCSREHSVEARRLRQRARADGEPLDQGDELASAGDPASPQPPEPDSSEQAPAGAERRRRVRRTALVAAAVVVVASAGTAIALAAGHSREAGQGSAGAAGKVGSTTASAAAAVVPAAAAEPPGLPTDLAVWPGDGQARLCWKPATGAIGYTLYYRDATAGQDWVRMPYPISETCYTSQLMVNNHTYEFKVRGGNLAGEGGFTNVVTATPIGPRPGVPTGLTAVPGNGQARLCWKPAPNADGYALFYRDVTAGQDWVRMPYPISATCYTSQLMLNSHAYEFKVCGGNLSGEGGFSNVVAVTPKR